MKTETTVKPMNGYVMAIVAILVLGIFIGFMASRLFIPGTIFLIVLLLIAPGFFIINPNCSVAFLLFGAYKGSVKENGFFWANPFFIKKQVSLKARNFESDRIKVNDKAGNPILISAILVWKVSNTYQALFGVDAYENFVKVQTDSAVRKLAGTYPYDHFEDVKASLTLSSDFDEINKSLEQEIVERLKLAGIEVIEARLGYLAYAPEIAQAMLKRQQATAVVAARHKIVEGAVSMVESALDQLNKRGIVKLDEEKKATMVSNLLIVLCGDKEVEPVINAGTLY
jgi:regulator of protease activity HflC (stomatin/prohibitin superfamily)